MKVYVRKGDYQSALPALFIMILFFAISILIFYACYYTHNYSPDNFIGLTIPLAFGLVFFAFSLYFLYALLKKPAGYQAKLISKTFTQYTGEDITLMTFETLPKDESRMSVPKLYTCFTYAPNDLVENRYYILKIKEFNWKIKSVEEFHGYETEDVAKKVPNVTMVPVIWGIFIIFASIGIWGLCGIINYPEATIFYVFPLFFSITATSGIIRNYDSLIHIPKDSEYDAFYSENDLREDTTEEKDNNKNL